MKYFDVNGVRMPAFISGTPGARPLVLLHGGSTTHTVWDQIVASFAADHQVYAVDQRGYGAASRAGDYTFEVMRDDVLGLLDAIGADNVDLIGHSMGATVAWLVAQAAGDRVAHLVAVDTLPPRPRTEPVAMPPRPEGELDFDRHALESIMAQFNEPDPSWWELLPKITGPVLIREGRRRAHRGRLSRKHDRSCVTRSLSKSLWDTTFTSRHRRRSSRQSCHSYLHESHRDASKAEGSRPPAQQHRGASHQPQAPRSNPIVGSGSVLALGEGSRMRVADLRSGEIAAMQRIKAYAGVRVTQPDPLAYNRPRWVNARIAA
jgi:pimeloyl-ACP methyl ester carboxylesterase